MRSEFFISLFLWLAAVVARAAGPETDPADSTVWPNQTSRANGDRWIAENHDRIRQMRPRVLIVNFSNIARREKTDRLVSGIISAIAEGSRYRGYTNANAPAFLKYDVLLRCFLPGRR